MVKRRARDYAGGMFTRSSLGCAEGVIGSGGGVCVGVAPWILSPLTPALSLLRGEGDTSSGVESLDELRRRIALSPLAARCRSAALPRGEDAWARRDAFEIPSTPIATPSPLNGERAGVRGEKTRDVTSAPDHHFQSHPCAEGPARTARKMDLWESKPCRL
jgi:hypothetical protein